MKVYNKLVVDIETGEHLEEDSYEYEGPVAQCVWAAVAAFAAVLSVAVNVGGAIYSADQQRKAADYNAYKEDEAADYANQSAANAEISAKNKAEYDEKIHRESVRRILSQQRALYGDSGLSMEGSPLLVMEDSMKQGELDALAIRHGGNINVARVSSSGNLLRMQGQNAQTAGYINAGSTLLAGAGKAAGAYGEY